MPFFNVRTVYLYPVTLEIQFLTKTSFKKSAGIHEIRGEVVKIVGDIISPILLY